MKKALFTLGMMSLGQMVFAQTNCATAVSVSSGTTTTVADYTGTFLGSCAGSGAASVPNAMWYKFTPTSNGELTVTSNLPQNDGVAKSDDTRLSIITTTGTCTGYTCYGGNDDVSSTNYLSATTIPVENGQTYYIVWDNRWSNLGFDFNVTFTPSTCIRPNEFGVYAPTDVTKNTANVSWMAAVGNPSSYDVQYGAEGFAVGSGTITNTTTTVASLSGLPTSANLDYYVRSNCGLTQSGWVGPFNLYLAKTAPYQNSFEAPNYADGFGGTGWSLTEQPTIAQNGTIIYFSNTSTTAVSNSQLYSRALHFEAGEAVSFNFYTRPVPATGNGVIKVYYNTQKSLTGATPVGTAINVAGTAYTLQTRTFTAPTAGTYYLIFSNESPTTTVSTSLVLDNLSVTSVLGTNEIIHSDVFVSIYPNPTTDIINVKSDGKVVSAQIFDLSGKLMNTRFENNKIDVRHLSSGNYLIVLETKEGKVTEKFTKK